MSATTGPILAIGGITVANRVVFHDQPMDWRIPIATGISAMMFTLAEKPFPRASVGLAYLALVTVLFTRLDPKVPAPAETLDQWLNKR